MSPKRNTRVLLALCAVGVVCVIAAMLAIHQWSGATPQTSVADAQRDEPSVNDHLGKKSERSPNDRVFQPATNLPVKATPKPSAKVEEQDAKAAADNLRKIGQAIQLHHDTTGNLPAQCSCDAKGKRLLSWRVHLLPYLEQEALYQRFHLDEPWDGPHNRELIKDMPLVFRSPGLPLEEGKTCMLALAGDYTAIAPPGPLRAPESAKIPLSYGTVIDGLAFTLAVVEVAAEQAVEWTKPEDIEVVQNRPITGISGQRQGAFLSLFLDGRVHRIPTNIDPTVLGALANRADRILVDLKTWRFPDRYPAKGRFLLPGGAPLTSGYVHFDNEQWYLLGDRVERDGTFSLVVPAGKYTLVVDGTGVPKKYAHKKTSPLVVEIKPPGSTDLVITLDKN